MSCQVAPVFDTSVFLRVGAGCFAVRSVRIAFSLDWGLDVATGALSAAGGVPGFAAVFYIAFEAFLAFVELGSCGVGEDSTRDQEMEKTQSHGGRSLHGRLDLLKRRYFKENPRWYGACWGSIFDPGLI